MKYCFNCNRITAGEPFFCNHCGSTYDAKLCPRLHANPRWADVCAQCGSRDMSTPQPRVPFFAKALLRLIPFAFATLAVPLVLLFLIAVIQHLANHPEIVFFVIILIALLWWLWTEIPLFIRKFIYRALKKKESREKH